MGRPGETIQGVSPIKRPCFCPLLAKCVKSVIHRTLQRDFPVVVPAVKDGKAFRDRLETPPLGRRVDIGVDIRGVNNPRQFGQPRVARQPVFDHDALEGASPVYMAQFGAGNIVRDGSLSPRYGQDLFRRHVQELRVLVDEPADEPGTCNPVHFRVLPSNPLHHWPPTKTMIETFYMMLIPPKKDRPGKCFRMSKREYR